jgi:hypothetical protein
MVRVAALESQSGVPDDVVIRAAPERRHLSVRARHRSFESAVAMVINLIARSPSSGAVSSEHS